jgi:pyruvate dehydrogenase E2 component (dihydrolipoamide acetyltransferase)
LAETIDIIIPDLGDFSDVEVIEVLVKAGDTVAAEDGLITLETDKATMDVPAPKDGTIASLSVSTGDKVSSGDVIGTMTVAGGDTVIAPAAKKPAAAHEETMVIETPPLGAPSPAAAKPAAQGKVTVEVPDIGDFKGVDVIEVHITAGDQVKVNDSLITLETDKATMDVPSEVDGTVESVLVKVGDTVSEGSPVAVINAVSAPVTPAAAPAAPSKPAAPVVPANVAAAAPSKAAAPRALPVINEAGFSKAHASPSVRKLARELGVDLVQVKGTGPKQRILHDDVKSFVKAILTGGAAMPGGTGLPKVPVVDYSKFGPVESKPLTRIQKISGPRLQASWINLPHVTQHDLADITQLEARRQELKGPAKARGISLTPLAFVMKACIAALKEFPRVNASLSENGESLVYKQYYHLGFAADTENGLMVPVIRDADKMDVYELAQKLAELSAMARDGKLKAEHLQGASFTVSSLGGIGGTAFTPIVNAPEVAILGVSKSSVQPVWNGKEFEPRLMLPLSFSYDHRVIDGAYAVRFTTFLSQALSEVDALLQAIP